MASTPSSIKFQDTGYFSRIICDYLDRKEEVRAFYHHFPDLEGFKNQISEKQASYPDAHREVLVSALREQYANTEVSEPTERHLNLLSGKNTFTVTTGHQLNLFTGPLYFLYKIISVINLCQHLKQAFPESDFVPIYWMASEDHDFDEIRFFNFKEKKLSWNREASGPVGRLSTEGLEAVYQEFESMLGRGRHAEQLREWFRKAYLEHKDLASATRYLANELFGSRGLVVLDGDDRSLKTLFSPQMERELMQGTCFEKVMESNEQLEGSYKIQVNPRQINLFYIEDGLRERIVHEGDRFGVQDTSKFFSREEILNELKRHPERFSPNALMRPLYQESILPNLCYVGGGGELAYWMQLRAYFEAVQVPFPILLLRNSALLFTEKQKRKLLRLGAGVEELFLPPQELLNEKVRSVSEIQIDFSEEKRQLHQMFEHFKELAQKTDKSFLGAVLAQEQKQLNGLGKLEKRMLKAQRRKHNELVRRITELQNQLFPKSSLQERQANFADFYEAQGNALLDLLTKSLDPLKLEFDLIQLD